MILLASTLGVFFSSLCYSKIKTNYGLHVGFTKNEKAISTSHFTPQFFNTYHSYNKKSYAMPLAGIDALFCYKHWFLTTSLEYSSLKSFHKSYDEHGFYYNENGQNVTKLYFEDHSLKQTYHKINIPFEVGFQFLNSRKLKPTIFLGFCFSYLAKGEIEEIMNFQDPFTKDVTQKKLNINAFNHEDNYIAQSRFNEQFIVGLGVNYNHNLALKIFTRKGGSLMVYEISNPNQYFMNSYIIQQIEYGVSLTYWLKKHKK